MKKILLSTIALISISTGSLFAEEVSTVVIVDNKPGCKIQAKKEAFAKIENLLNRSLSNKEKDQISFKERNFPGLYQMQASLSFK